MEMSDYATIFHITGGDDMEKLYEVIQKKRKKVTAITYAYIVFNGCWLFPIFPINISPYRDFLFWVLRLEMLVVYFYIAHIFYGLYNKRPLFVFCSTFVLNSIGLLCRVILEWGEYSITRDLTPLNTGIDLILIPVLVTVFYVLLPLLNHAKRG